MTPAEALRALPAALLAALAYAAFLRANVYRLPWARFLHRWPPRRQRFAVMAGKPLVLFGLGGVAGLAILGRLGSIAAIPDEFAAVRALAIEQLGDWLGGTPWWIYAGGIAAGGTIGAGVARLLRRPRLLVFGNLDAVLPRDRVEIALGALLSLDAALTEELFFRLFLPLALTLLTGQPVAAFAVAALLFGWAHRYQGPMGIAATTVVALLLSAIYLVDGHLWMAILVHAAIDLNALVLRPLILGVSRPFDSRPAGGFPEGRGRMDACARD